MIFNVLIKKRVICILLMTLFFNSQSKASDKECIFLSPLTEALSYSPKNESEIKNRAEKMVKISEGISNSAEMLFFSYLNQKLDPLKIDQCFYDAKITDEKIIKNYNAAVSGKFFSLTIRELLKFNGKNVEKFSKTLKEKSESGQLNLFKLVGHYGENNTLENNKLKNKAGFHRGQHSIYMDFTKIPARDWLIIFTHEYAHSLDTILSDSMPIFSDIDLQKRILSVIKEKNDLSLLTEVELKDLDQWLIAGLNRGFLAEVRAWALSFEVYEDLKKNSGNYKILWLEEILKKKMPYESGIQYAIRYLSPRFTDPTGAVGEGALFQSPMVLKRLLQLRTLISNGNMKISTIL